MVESDELNKAMEDLKDTIEIFMGKKHISEEKSPTIDSVKWECNQNALMAIGKLTLHFKGNGGTKVYMNIPVSIYDGLLDDNCMDEYYEKNILNTYTHL
ncbi:MAG: hypothetical protein WC119_02825 [Synergistaceae bacterium]